MYFAGDTKAGSIPRSQTRHTGCSPLPEGALAGTRLPDEEAAVEEAAEIKITLKLSIRDVLPNSFTSLLAQLSIPASVIFSPWEHLGLF